MHGSRGCARSDMSPSVPAYKRVIAIDGPAASGKSSVARKLAQKLEFVYVNSGAMYRALTWHVLQCGVDPHDQAAVAALVEATRFETDLLDQESRILIEGTDPSTHLREVRVNESVSLVSRVPRVRAVLVARMRAYAMQDDVVMEGRDIGSVVFPHTSYKFYIDASHAIRSQRRAAQGQTDQIALRDEVDSSRSDSPLTVAADAHVVDSSILSIDEVVSEILRCLRARNFSVEAKQVGSCRSVSSQ